MRPSSLFSNSLLLAALIWPLSVRADDYDWQQVRAEVHYVRVGTIATAKEGHFEFKLDVSIDQLLQRLKPKKGEKYHRYVAPYTHERAFKSIGTASLTGNVRQYDEGTQKTYTAKVGLSGRVDAEDELQIEEVVPADAFGEGMMAKLQVALKFQGAVTSDYPRLDSVSEADHVLLWPTPVANLTDEGFVSQGEWLIRPVLGPVSDDPVAKQLREMLEATNAIEVLPGLGGFRPPAVGCVTSGGLNDWAIKLSKTMEFELPTGGHYTDTVEVTIRPVKQTLPVPKLKPEAT